MRYLILIILFTYQLNAQTTINPEAQIRPIIKEFSFFGIAQEANVGFYTSLQSGQTNIPTIEIVAQEGPYAVLNFPACTSCIGNDDAFSYFIVPSLPDGYISNGSARFRGIIRTTDTSTQYQISVATYCAGDNDSGAPSSSLNTSSDITFTSSNTANAWINFSTNSLNMNGCDENDSLFIKVIRTDNADSVLSFVRLSVSVIYKMNWEF
jgi:hypothetical protein